MPEATDKRPLKVFLCHAHADREAVRVLYSRLKREGVDVWLDKEKLLPGADWEYEIRKAVGEADVVIVCLTKQFNQAGFRQKEVRIALDTAMEKPEGEIFMIPARLEECDTLERLQKWHWVDLFESDGFQRLMMALRLRAERIGATLRIRRGGVVPPPRPKNNELETKAKAEQEELEKISSEKAQLQAEELARQKAAQEQADREVAEKAAREKAEQEAIEKTRLHSEELARQKASQEQAEREAAEKAAREKAEQEAIEKARLEAEELERQKAAKEQANRETAERAAREKAERDAVEREKLLAEERARQKAAREVAERAAVKSSRPKEITSPRQRNTAILIAVIGIAGIIFAALIASPLRVILFPSPQPTTIFSTPTEAGTPSPTEITDAKGVAMRLVPAGEFTMGSENGADDEKPVHQVYLGAYYMDAYEVTNTLYQACVEAGSCSPPGQTNSYTRSNYYGNSEFDDYPVIYVDWNQAKAYCQWRSASLPTEAQWEKAARGTDGRTYPWGNMFDGTKLNFCDKNCSFDWADKTANDGYADTAPVGSYENGKSPYGIYDLAGNVWEWVADWYDSSYYANSPSSNPLGPSLGQGRVLRGGSWINLVVSVARSANRYSNTPGIFGYVGFRCTRSLP